MLANIAQLVESQAEGMSCTIWLPDEDGKELYRAAAPSLPGFSAQAGTMAVCARGGSCGTAIYRREPVYVTDILTDPIWDLYRDRLLPYGIRSVWSRPLFTSEGRALGTFSLNYREPRSPGAHDLRLIENASHITGIAIERHINEEALRRERDRLHLLLEITNSITSKLDLPRLVDVLSTNLLSVTRCDFCALLLPDAHREELRITILYNPEPRGAISDGAGIPLHGSICGKVFRTGKIEHFDSLEQVRDDPRVSATTWVGFSTKGCGGRLEVGLRSSTDRQKRGCGCVERSEAIGKRVRHRGRRVSGQVSRQVAIAVENALNYETATKDRDQETKQRLYLEEEIRAELREIVGESQVLKTALSLVSVVAPTDSSVLIQGETGTGKELIAARSQPELSQPKAFVKLNCAAIPLGLLESELFGHERGAFTGAMPKKPGALNSPTKVRFFLDEVGDILWNSRRNCYAFCRSRNLRGSAATARIRLTSASSRPPIAILPPW